MSTEIWLIDESPPIDEELTRGLEHDLVPTRGPIDPAAGAPLAIRLHDMTINDNKKWFGGADVRLDAIVVHGNGDPENPDSFYAPQTMRFPGVSDGERIPSDGLLIFYGQPKHFLDFSITVSRDKKDSDDLADLLKEQVGSTELAGAAKTVLSLAGAVPQAAAVTAALTAASTIGKMAYDIVRKATGNTIGLYRTAWLEVADGFGRGRHPAEGGFTVRDLSFSYEIVADE